MRRILFILFFTILNVIHVSAQDKNVLSAPQVLQILKQYHPIIRQAQIEIEKSEADILQARAAFDPIVKINTAQKTFNGENYYQYTTPEITIPTWYGVEVNAGFENLKGDRISITETLGPTNYLGFNIPLAKNLVIDKRRAFLQQSKIYNQLAIIDQQILVNDIQFDAMQAYWNWVRAYQTYLVVKNNVEVNENRLNLVRKAYRNGERPAIDTVENLSQLQSFLYLQNEEYLAFQQAGIELSAYLWLDNNEIYFLPETVVPESSWDNESLIKSFELNLANLLQVAETRHPSLLNYQNKLDVLQIDKKLKFQELLPKLDLQYNFLGKGYNTLESVSKAPLFQNNFQYGLKFEMPVRLSQGRSAYRLAKLKIEETDLDRIQKRQRITMKVKYYFTEMSMLKKQIELQSNNYNNYQRLVRAEEIRFENGESSLFLINSRENKALEALQKLIELKTKYYKSVYALQWSAGLLR